MNSLTTVLLAIVAAASLQAERFPALDFARASSPGQSNTTVEANLVSSGGSCLVYVDTRVSAQVPKATADRIASEFDRRIFPIVTHHFGPVPDGDKNNRIVVVVQSGVRSDIEGYHLYGNLVSASPAEILYISSALVQNVFDRVFPVLAHELQHLIAGKRRIDRGRYEGRWIDEGLSVYAEYLAGYGHNFGHLSGFGAHPETSVSAFAGRNGAAADHGAAYTFMMYLFEQGLLPAPVQPRSEQHSRFIRAVVAAGVPEYLERDGRFAELLRGWAVANYVDPLVNSVASPEHFNQYRYVDLDLRISIPGAQTHRICGAAAVPEKTIAVQQKAAQYAAFDADPALTEPLNLQIQVGGLRDGEVEAWIVLHGVGGAVEVQRIPENGGVPIQRFSPRETFRAAVVVVNLTDGARNLTYSASLDVGPCVQVGGPWQGREEGDLRCTFTALGETETDTDRVSGSGTVTFEQAGCSIEFDPPALLAGITSPAEFQRLRRRGTIEGNALSAEGLLAVVEAGASVTENSLRSEGRLENGVITLNSTGIVAGSATFENIPVSFSCSVTARALLTRNSPCGLRAATGVSAASFAGSAVSPESIGAVFGAGLAPSTQVARAGQLPTSLAGVSVTLTDSLGTGHDAGLFFVSATQINYLAPAGAAFGPAILTIRNSSGPVASAPVRVEAAAPSIFTADASGQGVAQAQAIRFRGDGSQLVETIFECRSNPRGCYAKPVDLGPESDRMYLSLYGTGIRGGAAAVTARVDGMEVPAIAAAQGQFAGLDQVNIGPLPRNLTGRGQVGVVVSVNGKATQMVDVSFR